MDNPLRPVDLNHASRDDLLTLPDLDGGLIDRILETRPYASLEQFRKKCALSRAQLKSLKPYLLFEPHVEENSAPVLSNDQPNEVTIAPTENEPAMDSPAKMILAPDVENPSSEPGNESEPVVIPSDGPLDETPDPDSSTVGAALVAAHFVATPSTPFTTLTEPEVLPAVTPVPESQPSPIIPISPVQTTPPQPSTHPATEQAKAKPLTRRELLAWVAASMLVTALVSILLTLGVLSTINGSLVYTTPSQFNTLNHQVDTLNSQAKTLSTDLDGLRSRVDTLDGLTGRISTVEKDTQAIHTQLDQSAKQVTQIQDQITSVNTTIQSLQKSSQTFQDFLAGLKNLLNGTTQP